MRNIPSRTRRALASVALVLSIAACTPQEQAAWQQFLDTRQPETTEQIVHRVFGADGDTAWLVAAGPTRRCPNGESGGNPAARSPGGGNHGLFQINSVHRAQFERVTGRPWAQVYDAEQNAIFAAWLHGQQGWGPWSCRP